MTNSILSAGMRIGDYELMEAAGKGAYGEVWVASDLTGKKVALKLVSSQLIGKSWERERAGLTRYRRLAPVQVNLLPIFHIGEHEGILYYTMELADNLAAPGEPYQPDTLTNRLQKRGRLAPAEVREMGLALAEALAELHRHKLAHRDVKPDNMIFVNNVPKLADIGLISDLNQSVSFAGTVGFLPPEAFSDHAPSTLEHNDLYALTKVLYCALTNFPPSRFPDLPPDLPLAECAGLNQALRRGADASLNNAEEFQKLLAADFPAPNRRRRRVIFAVLLLVVGLGTLAFWQFKARSIPTVAAPLPIARVVEQTITEQTIPEQPISPPLDAFDIDLANPPQAPKADLPTLSDSEVLALLPHLKSSAKQQIDAWRTTAAMIKNHNLKNEVTNLLSTDTTYAVRQKFESWYREQRRQNSQFTVFLPTEILDKNDPQYRQKLLFRQGILLYLHDDACSRYSKLNELLPYAREWRQRFDALKKKK